MGASLLNPHTVIQPSVNGQPAVVLTNRPWELPAGSKPLQEHLNQPAHFLVPTMFRNGDAEVLQNMAHRITAEFAELVENARPGDEVPTARIHTMIEQWLLSQVHAENKAPHEVVREAELTLAALQEVNRLRDADCFASHLIEGMARTLSYLGSDYEHFARFLFEQLLSYRKSRNEAEANFLEPYLLGLQELQSLLDREVGWMPGTELIFGRIKQGVLRKLVTRGMKNMNDIFDLAGLRVVVSGPMDVGPTIKRIEEALTRSRFGDPDEQQPYAYQIHQVETHDYPSGYQASHINILKSFEGSMRLPRPAAEIQVMTMGNFRWGEIQRNLVYEPRKAKKQGKTELPDTVLNAFDTYCSQAASYIRSCEHGTRPDTQPIFDYRFLTEIVDEKRRRYFSGQLREMEKLLEEYALRALPLTP